jgi:hypothetical protein
MIGTRAAAPYAYVHGGGKLSRRLPLPLRTRLRLYATRRVDTVCGWLCEHGGDGVAILVWRACGLW